MTRESRTSHGLKNPVWPALHYIIASSHRLRVIYGEISKTIFLGKESSIDSEEAKQTAEKKLSEHFTTLPGLPAGVIV